MPISTRRISRLKGVSLIATLSVIGACALAVVVPSGSAYAADSATINGATTYQTMAGFGASEAFGQASAVMNASSSVQQQALADLYSPTTGAGLTILRNEIGADQGNTIEPSNPGGPNATPSYLPMSQTNQDQGQLWFAQQIKARYGVTNVYADAWSAPGYMKTNGSASGGGQVCGSAGASCSSGDWRQAYSNYLVQYAKDYAAAGVPLTYVGPSNEPDYSTNYDSMTMSPAQMASVLDVLGPTVKNSGLSTQVTCCAATGWPKAGQYAAAIEADPTALAATAVATGHGYSGGADLAAAGLDQAGLGDRVVHLRRFQHRLGRQLRRLRHDLGPAHPAGPDRRQPQRIPLLVGRHQLRRERRQRGPAGNQRQLGDPHRTAVGVRQLQPLHPPRRGPHRSEQLQQRGAA